MLQFQLQWCAPIPKIWAIGCNNWDKLQCILGVIPLLPVTGNGTICNNSTVRALRTTMLLLRKSRLQHIAHRIDSIEPLSHLYCTRKTNFAEFEIVVNWWQKRPQFSTLFFIHNFATWLWIFSQEMKSVSPLLVSRLALWFDVADRKGRSVSGPLLSPDFQSSYIFLLSLRTLSSTMRTILC